MTFYDLNILEDFARELGFIPSRTTPDEVTIPILDGKLIFRNLRADNDTIAGFEGTAAHWHGKLILMTSEVDYVELDELDILRGIQSGELLIAERYLNSDLQDRWLVHQKEKFNLKYMQPGEEVRIMRIA